MRQGQQNRRGRGRNRKGQNPLTRSFESNGPDIKIRGTPSHIAEKYSSLARDAQSSGDPVLAENYLQHAEHYNRIIFTFREQQGGEAPSTNPGGRQRGSSGDVNEGVELAEEDNEELTADGQAGAGQHGDSQPAGGRSEGQRRQSRPQRGRRGANPANGTGEQPDVMQGRQNGSGRGGADRSQRRGNREMQSTPDAEVYGSAHEQPEFLRRPVRRPRRSQNEPAAESNETSEPAAVGDEAND